MNLEGGQARYLGMHGEGSVHSRMRTSQFWRDLFGVEELFSLDWRRLAVAFVLGFTGLYICLLSQARLQKVSREEPNVILADVGFENLPYIHNIHLPDHCCTIAMICTALRFFVFAGPQSLRWIIFRRWVVLLGTLFLLRGFSIACTVLPNPAKNCVPKISTDNVWLEALYLLASGDVTCQDVLYSGHTVNITLCALLWMDYSTRAPLVVTKWGQSLVKIVVCVYAFVSFLIIIAARFHYTVDVWMGFWMTFFVWKYYHNLLRWNRASSDLTSRKSIALRMNVVMRVLTWLEETSPERSLSRQLRSSENGAMHSGPFGPSSTSSLFLQTA